MDQTLFDELQGTFSTQGATEAIDQLIARLKEQKEYGSLFYALLMKKRQELGVSPVPTGPASDLPSAVHEPYEEGIRQAARLVGNLFLEQGDIQQAWGYFRMLGEPQPVIDALEKYQPGEGEDSQGIIELAFHHGVHPRKGFEWVLQRFGICSAITAMSGALNGPNFPHGAEARDQCLKLLTRALCEQLVERLRNDIVRQEGTAPETRSVPALLAGRDWLMAEDNYHIDVSHLGAVIQMGSHLPRCEELTMLREMCAYGQRLSPQFQYRGEPPFEDQYKDYSVFYAILDGDNVEANLAHFHAKAENPNPDYSANLAAEMLVNLLLRLDRTAEALSVSRRFLATADPRQLSCPNITELCRRVNDYRTLAEVSREQGDPVHFVAGLIAASSKPAHGNNR